MRRLWALAGLAAAPVVILGVFFVLPVAGMLREGLWADGSFSPGSVLEVLGRSRTTRVLWFTVWSAGTAALVTLVMGIPAAYVLHRLRFPGRGLLRALFLVPFVLPTVVVGIAFTQLIDQFGWTVLEDSPWAIIAAMVFFNLAVVVRTVGSAWESLDPRPGEAAAALGAPPWRVFATVTLPALRGSIVSAATVVFLFCATAFGVVLVLGGLRYATVESEIYLLTTNLLDRRAAAALCLLQLLVVTVLLYAAHRARAHATPAVARRTPAPLRVRRGDAPALLVTVAALALVVVPIASLVSGSFTVDGEWGLANYRNLDRLGSGDQLSSVRVTDALVNSLRVALDATWIALLVGGLVAVIVTRRSRSTAERRIRGVLDGFFMLPLGVSAVTLGFGFLITLDEPPLDFRDSPMLVPMAQALVAMPLVVRTIVPVLAGIDDRQRQAAASLGAGPMRTVLSIDLAVVWKPLLAAAGLAFAVSLGEFGATSFISRADHPTLPVVIFQLLGQQGRENYGMALAASVLLAGVTALVMLVVERLRVPGMGGF